MSELENHRNILNEYAEQMAKACTQSEMRNVAMLLFVHMAYLLGRESMRIDKGEQTEE